MSCVDDSEIFKVYCIKFGNLSQIHEPTNMIDVSEVRVVHTCHLPSFDISYPCSIKGEYTALDTLARALWLMIDGPCQS